MKTTNQQIPKEETNSNELVDKTSEKTSIKADTKPIQESSTTLGYAGTVNITVRHGNKVIKKYSGKNFGGTLLFKFLCQALAGEFITENRPFSLQLVAWTGKSGGTITLPTTWTGVDNGWAEDDFKKIASQAVAINTTPVIKSDFTNVLASVTFSWLIPYSALMPIGEDTFINQLYLLDNLHTLDSRTDWIPSENVLAIYNIPPSNWFKVQEDDWQKGLNLIIDWALTIGNSNE